ncbi:type II toxin-antitoxin system PemK/MazF family toxin [Propionimicrobium sp. PCR01-08-3]|uniref:type II toxin-antitoxin system PemK/MazF family toxin n=1 Tax=Propionimicrobium sp. PCR01-08-3 TaxID=3052086 RepID=UPI00255CEE66|nr:type II toxin-antitoxin system PemK/MazF family toxin [Propionimicrobium sp. PCR01-08-3]WIY81849.1 type II toxin-antitoxin system PemK/MazF family toxin [Propionimicrobium sp. PCR01-08-3]
MVTRGEIWWVDFGDPIGSEPGYRRPALVVSSDRFNRSRIATVIVTALTSNLRLAVMPGNVELEKGEADLPKDCVVNVSQTLVIDRSRLSQSVGTLSAHLMAKVDEGLRLVLAL